jgi:hypothetical protein
MIVQREVSRLLKNERNRQLFSTHTTVDASGGLSGHRSCSPVPVVRVTIMPVPPRNLTRLPPGFSCGPGYALPA